MKRIKIGPIAARGSEMTYIEIACAFAFVAMASVLTAPLWAPLFFSAATIVETLQKVMPS